MEMAALQGFTVGITATRRWEDQASLLQARGAAVLHGPMLSVDISGADADLRSATENLIAQPPDLTILCTGAGAAAWFAAAQSFGADEALLAALSEGRVLARGPKTTAAAITAGLPVPRRSGMELLREVMEAAAAALPLQGARVAVQLDGGDGSWLHTQLHQAGATVIPVRPYRWRTRGDSAPGQRLLEAICQRRVHAVTFTSTPAVTGLFDLAAAQQRSGELCVTLNRHATAISVGPVTSAALRRHGVTAPLEPSRARLGAMIHTLTAHLQARRRQWQVGTHTLVVQGAAAQIDGRMVSLSARDHLLLEALTVRAGQVVGKTELAQHAGLDPSAEHALEVAVGRLRRRLGPAGAGISTVFRRGYRFDAQPCSQA